MLIVRPLNSLTSAKNVSKKNKMGMGNAKTFDEL